MDSTQPISLEQQPDIFKRSTLEQTFQVLRQKRPALALAVQNMLADEHMDHQLSAVDSGHDLFMIKLDAGTIGQIVRTLTQLGEELLSSEGKSSQQLPQMRTLIEKWSQLGMWLVAQNCSHHL